MDLLHIMSIPLLVMILQPAQSTNPITIEGGVAGTCPSQEKRDAAIQSITLQIQARTLVLNPECGPGLWHRVAYLNMSDPSQQCPLGSAWMEYNSSGVRACIRPPFSMDSNCSATLYATSRQYNRVCGRVIGYQIGSTDAFGYGTISQLDSPYVYGVSITHGTPRNHIWTYAAGVSEGNYSYQQDNCPCSNSSHPNNIYPPSFVGDNYYCESGNPTDTFSWSNLYGGDRLWDGEQCEGECCSGGKSPPWFSVELSNPITDDIEVRICSGEEDNRDEAIVQLLELYVQ